MKKTLKVLKVQWKVFQGSQAYAMIKGEGFGSDIGTSGTSRLESHSLSQNTDLKVQERRRSSGGEIEKMEYHMSDQRVPVENIKVCATTKLREVGGQVGVKMVKSTVSTFLLQNMVPKELVQKQFDGGWIEKMEFLLRNQQSEHAMRLKESAMITSGSDGKQAGLKVEKELVNDFQSQNGDQLRQKKWRSNGGSQEKLQCF
mmetsp:Transcript_24511/g.36764  ORF Transcript_24511/g.36764 Transcript_24511/m.36764 type:complete len:201 (-) Transcript_24511:518-1120(-)